MNNQWKPKGWLAVLLAVIFQPLAFLYVNRSGLLWWYLLFALGLTVIDLTVLADPAEGVWYQGFSASWLMLVIVPVHAYLLTRNYDINQPRGWYASWWSPAVIFTGIMAVIIAVRAFYFEPFAIPAGSMSPTLNPGDHLIVNKSGFGNYRTFGIELLRTAPSEAPGRGDIIVFQYPLDPAIEFVKRVIALPGDKIIYRNKTVYIKPACQAQAADNCPEYASIKKSAGENLENGSVLFQETIGNQGYNILIEPVMPDRSGHFYYQSGTQRDEWLVPDGHYFVLGDNRDNSLDSRFWGFVPQENIIGKAFYIW